MNDYNKKKLCFFLTDAETHFQGGARPFINWAIELSKKYYEIDFILLRCGEELKDFIKTNIVNVHLKSIKNFAEMLQYINSSKPDLLISDDYFPRLRFVTKIKNRAKIRTLVYVQMLFGFHSIAEVFNLKYLSLKHRITFGAVRCIPFYFLKLPYKNLLLKQNLIAANSNTTAMLLHILYGVELVEVIYPPVNTTHFRFRNRKEKNQALVYLGSFGSDTDENFVRKTCEALKAKGFHTLIFGNKNVARKLMTEFRVHHLDDVTDEELARIYSETNLTVCPQKWETFGYAVAESICCGTPVIAYNCMGTGEILSQVNNGFLANNQSQLLGHIKSFTTNEIEKDTEMHPWDIVFSTKKLDSLIQIAI